MNLMQRQAATPSAFRFIGGESRARSSMRSRYAPQVIELPNKISPSKRLPFIEEQRLIPFKFQQDCQLIQLPKFSDHRGSLSFIEGGSHIPFKMQSVYWINDISDLTTQVGNFYRGRHEFIVAMSGRVEVAIEAGQETRAYCLDRPDQGLHVPYLVWRQMESLSTDAVILVLASQPHPDQVLHSEPLLRECDSP